MSAAVPAGKGSDDEHAEVLARIAALEARMEAFFATLGRQVARSADSGYSQVEALVGLYRELDGRPTLPPMRRWAISPDAARELRQLVADRRPAVTVELGSGVSTLLIGMALRELGTGSLVAFEHDPVFWVESNQRVEAFGLEDVVSVRYAPLVTCTIGEQEFLWYDLEASDLDGSIELVVVDGPPETTGPEARFPALPMLRDRCGPNCVFFLDDYVRAGEQAMAARWIAEYGAELVGFSSTSEKWTAVVAVNPTDVERSDEGNEL